MRWSPEIGHIPRGFGGARGEINDIKLVIVNAEPGDPADGEAYDGSPNDMLMKSISIFENLLENKTLRRNGRIYGRFHENLAFVLNSCFPGKSLDNQLRLTWITPAVKCSAMKSGGPIPQAIETTCASLYLKREIDFFPGAYVLALGNKARDRLLRARIRVNGFAQHPSARPNTGPRETWESAGAEFRAWFQLNDGRPSPAAASSE
jgi:hypothetical protein